MSLYRIIANADPLRSLNAYEKEGTLMDAFPVTG